MRLIYAAIFALLIPTTVSAQDFFQDNIFGDNVIQQNNYYNRPAKVVKKVVKTGQKNVYNTYNIYENTTVAPPVTVVTPPPVTVVRPVPVPVPVPVVPYYAPVPMPVPVYGGYYGYY